MRILGWIRDLPRPVLTSQKPSDSPCEGFASLRPTFMCPRNLAVAPLAFWVAVLLRAISTTPISRDRSTEGFIFFMITLHSRPLISIVACSDWETRGAMRRKRVGAGIC